jgi:serine/threonine-protein kinase
MQWDEIVEIFSDAVDVPEAERDAWLTKACSGREELRREVEAMLRANAPGEALEIEEKLAAVADDGFREGDRLGSYRILRFLGRGGMGEVYLATRLDADFEQLVAVKVLGTGVSGSEAAARFRRERRILARLTHPAIVPLLDGGVAPDGRPYLVLQYVDGLSITKFSEAHQLDTEARLRLFATVCRVVQYAHGRLIIHRDLKPSNILVTSDGQPRLLDFGIAKALSPDDSDSDLTRQRDTAPMTIERAAPEQLRGDVLSTATDVWALGVLLHELLTGRLPFEVSGRSRSEIEKTITSETMPRLRGELRGDLETILSTALRLDPESRYASAGQFADDIERYLAGQPILARPQSAGYRIRRFIGRNRAAVSAGALALVSLVVFTAVTVMQSAEVARDRDRVAAEQLKANAVVDLLTEVLQGADPNEGASGPTLDVNELLARGEARADALQEQPAVRARLYHVLGKVHLGRSSFRKAKELLDRAHALALAAAGPDDARTLEMATDLARAEQNLGQRGAAAKRLEDVIRRLEGRRGETALLANALEALADVSEVDRQMPLLIRALDLRRQLVPAPQVKIAESLNGLAIVEAGLGQRDQAVRHYRESLALITRERGPDDPDTLSVKNNLALTISDPVEKEALFRSLIAAHTRRFGDRSHAVAVAWNNLGTTLAERGDFRGALDALGMARDRWVAILGPDQLMTLNTRRSIAAILDLSGDREASLREMREIVAAADRGALTSTMKASLRAQEAAVLLRLGRIGEARHEMTTAYADICRIEPEGAVARTNVQMGLGLVLLAEGESAAAERELAQALTARRKALRPGDLKIAEAQVAVGRAMIANGKRAEGSALIREVFPAYSRYPLAHPLDVAAARKALGM